MAKHKTPKLNLSLLTSFQICRPKKPSSMIKSPLPPSSYLLSPLNSKIFDISFPGTPIPPPSTPSAKITPLPSTSPDNLFSSSPPSFNSGHTLKEKPRRFKRCGSKKWKEGEECCSEKKPMLGRSAPCMNKGRKVNQSFVVVKKSVDPYEDFKRSMSEMILEKEMFEPKELEQLLISFLELNSPMHHRVIIEAFTQILKEVFCG